jgi:hypothetical protein
VAIVCFEFGIRTCKIVAFLFFQVKQDLDGENSPANLSFSLSLSLSLSSFSVYGIDQRRASEMNQMKGV